MILILCLLSFLPTDNNKKQGAKRSIESVKRLEWIDPYGRNPKNFSNWRKSTRKLNKFRIGRVVKITTEGRANLIDIIVDSRIYDSLSQEISQYSNDLANEGYSVQVDTVSGMSIDSLRNHLAGITDLNGAVFIGELPIAWYEMSDWAEEEFPIDLYFMDLDGNWVDSDNDGLFDGHTGNVEPEIWMGRLYARPLLWDDEITLLRDYFAKNHQYRTGGLGVLQRGLSFVDDDWYYYGSCSLDSVYSDVTVINDYASTTAPGYRSELNSGYEWIHICAHSSPWGHTFKNSYDYAGTVFNYELFVLNPQAIFYNLFACSGTRFVEENHSAGWYLFGDNPGLSVVGSTKTGAMLYFGDFYKHLGNDDNIGEAFKKWFIENGELSRPWFYGLNILGDPTLKCLMGTGFDCCETVTETSTLKEWTTPVPVGSNPESDGFPRINTINGKLWLVFESGRSPDNGRSDIYTSCRESGGWVDVMNVGPHVYWDYKPVIGVQQGEPVAVWAHFNSDYNYSLRYSRFSGGNWSSPGEIPGDGSWDLSPTVASTNDTLYLAWQTRRDLDSDIYFSALSGGGWSTPEKITQSDNHEFAPAIVADSSGSPWVFYCKYAGDSAQIWYTYREGGNWTEGGPLSGSQMRAYSPDASVDTSGRILLVWQGFDEGKGNIYFNSFNGDSWGLPEKIPSACDNNVFPSITSDKYGVTWIAWQGKNNDEWDIYTVHSEGVAWSNPEVVSLAGPGINPSITTDTSGVWVSWQNYRSNQWDIYVSGRGFAGVNEDDSGESREFGITKISPSIIFDCASIIYSIPERSEISVAVYDISGRMVKTLKRGEVEAGTHRVKWEGRNSYGNRVSRGIYFCRLKTGKNESVKKMVILWK